MDTITFSLIQCHLFWEDKASNLNMLEEKIASINTKTEIVVLPEMFSTGFSMQPEKFAENMQGECIEWMKKIASKYRIILTGSLMIEENGEFYNRLIWMQPNKQFGFYNKRHCFAYANEHEHYSPGNSRLIVSVNGWKINLQICYDLRFPVWARQANQNNTEYDILLYVANWPKKRNHAWKTLLTARAIENQCYVIGVNRVGTDGNNIIYSGDSMVVDALGEILYHKEDVENVFTITLSKNNLNQIRTKFPFLKDADYFKLIEKEF